MAETDTRRPVSTDSTLQIVEEIQQSGVQTAKVCRRHGVGTRSWGGNGPPRVAQQQGPLLPK
jgi:transposase-like protein